MKFSEIHTCQKETLIWLISILEYISTESEDMVLNFDRLYPILSELGKAVNKRQRVAIMLDTDGEVENYEGSFPKLERLPERRTEADEALVKKLLSKR